MPMIRRLKFSAAVYRPAISQSATGTRSVTLDAVSGMSAVPCMVHPRSVRRSSKEYGNDIEFDAMAYFKAGTDIRPGQSSSEGKGDRLTITDEQGGATDWLVVSTREPANARKLLVVLLRRSAT